MFVRIGKHERKLEARPSVVALVLTSVNFSCAPHDPPKRGEERRGERPEGGAHVQKDPRVRESGTDDEPGHGN